MNVTELKSGNYFLDEGNLYFVIDNQLNKTAMRKMVAKIKVKNMRNGAITEISRNSGYNVEKTSIQKRKMVFLYDSGISFVFMDNESYEQFEISKSKLENEQKYLAPNAEIDIMFYEDEILGISLPPVVTLLVTDCELSVRGDTINKAMKLATLETGYQIKVPEFINAGEKILVKVETGEYQGRA